MLPNYISAWHLFNFFGTSYWTTSLHDISCDLYLTAVERKTARILDDAKHPLFSQFQKLRSGRRYKVPIARKNVYKKYFIPSAISVLNSRAT